MHIRLEYFKVKYDVENVKYVTFIHQSSKVVQNRNFNLIIRWVTYKDKQSSNNPSFYCDICYRQFHYSHEGKLLYNDFEVFRYYHE